MKHFFTLCFVFLYIYCNAQEVNNSFETATPITVRSVTSGKVNANDQTHFYKTVLPADGTLKIYLQATNNSGGNSNIQIFGYDNRKGTVLTKYNNNNGSTNLAPGATSYDTLTVYGIAADTFYFQIYGLTAYSYSFSYDIIDTSENDIEPNNTFETALPINILQQKKGHIGYKNGVLDANDFYKTVLPADGTLKIYLQATNNSGGNSNTRIFGYDNRKGTGEVLIYYNNNNGATNLAPGATSYDTLTVYGIAADTFYFRLEALTAYSYSFSYDIIDTSENDMEPNNTFETALPINILQQKKGHIGYKKSGVLDANDFYKTVLPADGTLKIYLQATNNSGGNSNTRIFGYDNRKGTGEVLIYYNNNNGATNLAPGATSYDTLTVYGIAADTFYFRLEGLTAYSYSFSYDLLNPLNITLGNITAINVGDRNQIEWNTLTEDAGDYFVAEGSSNGINFTPFNTIKARGIPSTYQVFDDHPTSGKNYYRLRTYDKDGKFKLSKVVSAFVNKSGMFVVEAYPNPVSEILKVNIQGTIEGTATISVTNVQGLQVQKTSVTRNNLFINLSRFAKGTYFIKYNDSKHSEVIKVIKN